MKNLLAIAVSLSLLSQIALAQTPSDSTEYFVPSEYLSFKENYNAHAAFVVDNRWTTSVGTQSLGRRWKNVAGEFEVSPEGQAALRQALAQRKFLPVYFLSGFGLLLGSIPLMASSSQLDWQTGLGLGVAAGSFALILAGGKKVSQSEDNFNRAVWLRNRDAMLLHTSPTDQPRFRYLYETETLYLTTNSYVKNGREQKLGFLGGKAAGEFRDIPTAWNMYEKYRKNQRVGTAVNIAGSAVAIVSLFSSGGSTNGWLFLGGSVTSSIGSGITLSGQRFLREAVHIRNYNVLNQKILPESK